MKQKNIIVPHSWDDDIEALDDELTYMEALKKESKEFNEKFWEKFDELNKYDNSNIPQSEFYEEAFRFAKEGG